MEQNKQPENTQAAESATLSKEEEKAARKARMLERRLARRAKRNARIAYARTLKNLIIWFMGFIALPIVIAVAALVVPVSVITGNDGSIVSEDLSKRSVLEIVKFVAGNPGDLGFSDLPIVARELSNLQDMQIGEKDDGEGGVAPIKVGDLIHIDTDKLNTIKFGDGNMASEATSCIEVIATIESIGGASALGDFGNLSVFTVEDIAGTVAEINAQDESAETRKQYYYKTEENKYIRAFDDEGNLVGGLNDTDNLFYPPLEKIKLGELKDIIGDSIGRTTISSLLDTLGGGNDKLIDIIGADRTIKGIKDFDINTVALSNVLEDNAENAKLWNILKDVTGKDATADITIGDLAGINTDDIYLTTVLPAPDAEHPERNKKLYDILLDITPDTVTAYEEIKVSDLSGLNTDNLHLTTVLEDNAANAKLYDILKDLSGKSDASDIIVEDLSGLDTDNLHLSVVLEDNAANAKLYDILKDLTNKSAAEITVSSLSGIDTNELHLNTVLDDVDLSENKVLSALKEKNIQIKDIGTALNGLSLYEVYGTDAFRIDTTVTTLDMARSFYKVFNESGKTVYMLESNGVVSSLPTDAYYICYTNVTTPAMSYETATILGAIDTSTDYYKCTNKTTHLVSFETSPDPEVYVIDGNSVYHKTADDNYFVLSDTTLYKITDENSREFFLDNRDLLIKSDTNEYFACYDSEGEFQGYFTATDANAAGYTYDNTEKYIKATDSASNTVYVLDEKQYLDKSAGIWLLLSFDTAEYDTNDNATRRFADQHGKAYKYDVDNMTIGHLSKGSNFAKKFKNATIKQLVDSGLVDDPQFSSGESYKYSLQELLEIMKTLL